MMASIDRFGTGLLAPPSYETRATARPSPCLRNALLVSSLLWLALGYGTWLIF
jgi:hypothetical protein